MKTLRLFLLFLVFVPLGTWAQEEVDTLGVAAVLLRDGNLDKAAKLLDSVDPQSKSIHRGKYYTLKGLVALKKGEFAPAEASFRSALAEGQTDPTLTAYLAQTTYAQSKWAETVRVLRDFGRMNAFPDLWGMLAQAHWNLGDRSEAFQALSRAQKAFPSRLVFVQQALGYYLELGLTQAAAEAAQALLEKAGDQPGVHLAVGESFRRAGQPRLALPILETARLRFPGHVKTTLALGQAYADVGLPATAARLVESASLADGRSLADAVELYRRAGDYGRALFLNGQMTDSTAKAKQRFSLLLDAQRFEEAMVMKGRLERLGLLVEDRWRYAAAFAAYRIQDYDQAQGLLSGIADPVWFGRSVQLRRAIDTARAETLRYF